MRRAGWLIAVAVLLNAGEGMTRRARWKLYVNKRFQFQFIVPVGFQVSEQATHPTILVAARHDSGAAVRVAFKPMGSRITRRAFARKEVQVARKLGFKVGKLEDAKLAGLAASKVEGSDRKNEWGFTQYFVIRQRKRGWVGFVLTLTYPVAKKTILARSFDMIILSFKFL